MGLNSSSVSEDKKEDGACELLLNGKPFAATSSRWLPYEVQRKGTTDSIEMRSSIRLPFEQKGVLIRLVIYNRSSKARTFDVSMNCFGRVRYYPGDQWQTWDNTRPEDSNFVAEAQDGKTLLVRDQSSPAVTAFSFVTEPDSINVSGKKGEVSWHMTVAPGGKRTIECVCAIGHDAGEATIRVDRWVSDFGAQFDAARKKWEERWENAFVPGNKYFSGHFPTLVTNDPKIRRVYYMGVLTPLLICRSDQGALSLRVPSGRTPLSISGTPKCGPIPGLCSNRKG
jgi:hypothetical protein